jgi:hypothetical protein
MNERLNILYFSVRKNDYYSGQYQEFFPKYLTESHDLLYYGPGYSGYDPQHTIDDVLDLFVGCDPDLICFGSGWEYETHPTEYDIHPNINTKKIKIPKVLMLNKEYKKIEKKLEYIQKNDIDLVFSAYHDCAKWEDIINRKVIYFPFAVDTSIFKQYYEPLRYDFGFSGSLHSKWISSRTRIKDELFFWKRIPRIKYIKYKIFWEEWGNKIPVGVEYARLLNSSKMWISTPSAIGLVGTRFYEILASKTLLFCVNSKFYGTLFSDKLHCVMFEPDLSDFHEKLSYYISEDDERNKIIENGYQHVIKNHTWQNRVQEFNSEIEYLF